jgi:DNA primase
MIPQSTIDEILQVAKIEEVVGDVVQLKRSGSNLTGLCPFHNEKTPSFSVSPSREIYKCFGCGEAGNVIGFVMDYYKVGYKDALYQLADKYNIKIEEEKLTEEDKETRTKQEEMFLVNDTALKFYKLQLKQSDEGKMFGLTYLRERGVSQESIEGFELGWSPAKGNALTQYMLNAGYSKELLIECGLTLQSDNDDRLFDKFRDRLMFPIHNVAGKVVGFAGRILKKSEKTAKYVNSAETELYKKSELLYGFHLARKTIRQKDCCIMVEGYTDVIALHEAGVYNAVASSGTSLTRKQLDLVRRHTQNIHILYDGDDAGIAATLKAIDLALEEGLLPQVISLPNKHDPDSFARANSLADLQSFVDTQVTDFMDFQLSALLPDSASINPINLSSILTKILESLSFLKDPITRQLYIKNLATKVGLAEELLYRNLQDIYRRRTRKALGNEAAEILVPTEEKVSQPIETELKPDKERRLLQLLVLHGEQTLDSGANVAEELLNLLENHNFQKEEYTLLYQYCVDVFKETGTLPQKRLTACPDVKTLKLIAELMVENHEISTHWKKYLGESPPTPAQNLQIELADLTYKFLYENLKKAAKELEQKIKTETDEKELQNLVSDYLFAKEEMKKLTEKFGIVISPK